MRGGQTAIIMDCELVSALKRPRTIDGGMRRLKQVIGLTQDLGGCHLRGRAFHDQGVESIGAMLIGHTGLLSVAVVAMIACFGPEGTKHLLRVQP
jgi:hypothetical protein